VPSSGSSGRGRVRDKAASGDGDAGPRLRCGLPFSWITADEAYGQVKYLRVWLETRDAAHVLATKRNDTLITITGGQARADDLIAALPSQAWRRISAGAGSHGPREYDWARVPIRIGWARGRGHWLLARRSISDPAQIAYYVCYGPRRSSLADLAWTAGARWRIEECFQQARTKPAWTTTRSAPGEPGTPTSPCRCSPTPGSRSPDP
jgi:hypothetical protein